MALIDYVTTNIQSVYNRVGKLYQLEIEGNGDPDTTVPALRVDEFDGTLLNRDARRWLLNRDARRWLFSQMRKMATVLNDLIGLYNDQGLRDLATDDPTDGYVLSLPQSLMFNDRFMAVLQDDFDRAYQLCDRLTEYVSPYIK